MSDTQSQELSHFDQSGQAHMVDVGNKAHTKRLAVAGGIINMLPSTLKLIKNGDAKKGDVLGIAVDRGMCIGEIKLLEKSGGKSGDWIAR